MSNDLYIFDQDDNLLTILSNTAKDACPFWDAAFEEELDRSQSFEVIVPGDHPDAVHVVEENQMAFRDRDGDFRLFVVRELEDLDGERLEKRAYCEPAFLENNDEPVEDIRAYDTTALDALTRVLTDRRWKVGIVAELGIYSDNFYYITVTESIQKILNTWGGELKDRIEITDNRITGRYVDILPRRGADTGKRFEIDKDIQKMSRTVLSYPKTALYGRGKGIESGDGFSRRITFAGVEWSVANGDPVDKPIGQEWVGDPDALTQYGRLNEDGSRRHRFGFFDDSEEEDPAALLQSTWEAVQERKRKTEAYEMGVLLLEKVSGREHEAVRLGDTNFIINRRMKPELFVETRIIRFKYYLEDPDDERAEVTLGSYIPLFTEVERLDQIEAKLNDRSGVWESGAKPVTDEDFPDTVPPVPTGVAAFGLFKTILVKWDYDDSSYISAYELYASKVEDFEPDLSNLIFRGKTGGFTIEAETEEQWYFRVRAINTHGTASDYSSQIIANTVQINGTIDIEPLTITNELIAENAEIDGAKIADATIGDAHIINVDAAKLKADSVIADNITFTGTLQGATGTFSGKVTAANLFIDGNDNSQDSALTFGYSRSAILGYPKIMIQNENSNPVMYIGMTDPGNPEGFTFGDLTQIWVNADHTLFSGEISAGSIYGNANGTGTFQFQSADYFEMRNVGPVQVIMTGNETRTPEISIEQLGYEAGKPDPTLKFVRNKGSSTDTARITYTESGNLAIYDAPLVATQSVTTWGNMQVDGSLNADDGISAGSGYGPLKTKTLDATGASGRWIRIARIQNQIPIGSLEFAQFTGTLYLQSEYGNAGDQQATPIHFSFGSRGGIKPVIYWGGNMQLRGSGFYEPRFLLADDESGWNQLWFWQPEYSRACTFVYCAPGCTEFWNEDSFYGTTQHFDTRDIGSSTADVQPMRFGHDVHVNSDGGNARWSTSNEHYLLQRRSDGAVFLYMGGSVKHSFAADGTKSGGTIVIDDQNLGMSPIDSPQILIEYVEFDIQLDPVATTKYYLDEKYIKAVEHWDAKTFRNDVNIIEKGINYIVLDKGTGTTSVEFIGERVGYANAFWEDMSMYDEELGGELLVS